MKLISLDQFIKKYSGKQVEYHSYDPRAKYQCVDLANQFIVEVLGLDPVIGTDAKDFPKKVNLSQFEVIENTPDFKPKACDIAIWNRLAGGGAGHISVVIDNYANLSTFNSIDQNWSKSLFITLEKHTYTNVSHFIRAKVQSTPEIPAEVSMPDELQGLLEHYKVKSVSELKTMVDTQLGYLSDERKKNTNLQAVVDDNNRHMEELSTKLSTTADYPAILAEVTELLAVEEVNRQLEKKLDAEEKKHDQERNQLVDRVDQLQKAVEESQRNSERLLIELDAVKTKLNGLEAQGAFLTRFQSILQSIFKRTA